MKFNEIEGVDPCEDVTIYWAVLSDMPEAVQSRAREIDGVEYDALGFGVCVGYDFAKKDFFIFTDNDTVADANIYYVDKNGDRRWFQVEIGDDLTKQIFDACDRINACVDTPWGYAIQKTAQFGREFGLVLAKKDDPARPFTVWTFQETQAGYRSYGWGHGYADEQAAEKAFADAVAARTEHERAYHSPTATATIWGAGKRPSIKTQLTAAKAAQAGRSADQQGRKDKGRGGGTR